MTRAKTPSMILPVHDRASGAIVEPLGGDSRVPRRIYVRDTSHWYEPQALAAHHRPEQCPNGRHLFDVIESARDVETEHEDGSWDHRIEFRARLTCVRCGYILSWEGTRDGDGERPRSVDPTPLSFGDLLAQQVSRHDSLRNGQDFGTWVVYRAGEQVGVISWASGPRGRAFYKGRLTAWPEAVTVEGKTAIAVLRALARDVAGDA